MADITVFDISGVTAYANYTGSSISTGTAARTIPCENGKGYKLAVRVSNGSGSTLTATFKAASDGGVRTGLGDYTVSIADGQVYYYDMSDTARFKDLSDDDIDLQMETAGTAALVITECLQM
jgi:hypothetical protein